MTGISVCQIGSREGQTSHRSHMEVLDPVELLDAGPKWKELVAAILA